MDLHLKDKIALVIGTSRGLGYALFSCKPGFFLKSGFLMLGRSMLQIEQKENPVFSLQCSGVGQLHCPVCSWPAPRGLF